MAETDEDTATRVRHNLAMFGISTYQAKEFGEKLPAMLDMFDSKTLAKQPKAMGYWLTLWATCIVIGSSLFGAGVWAADLYLSGEYAKAAEVQAAHEAINASIESSIEKVTEDVADSVSIVMYEIKVDDVTAKIEALEEKSKLTSSDRLKRERYLIDLGRYQDTLRELRD